MSKKILFAASCEGCNDTIFRNMYEDGGYDPVVNGNRLGSLR